MELKKSMVKYLIDLTIEEIKLPPFRDILILTKNAPQGKIGLSKSFELIIPNGFEIIEVDNPLIEAVYINRKILTKLSSDKIINILSDKVFPYVTTGELIRVDFKIAMQYNGIEYSTNGE